MLSISPPPVRRQLEQHRLSAGGRSSLDNLAPSKFLQHFNLTFSTPSKAFCSLSETAIATLTLEASHAETASRRQSFAGGSGCGSKPTRTPGAVKTTRPFSLITSVEAAAIVRVRMLADGSISTARAGE